MPTMPSAFHGFTYWSLSLDAFSNLLAIISFHFHQ